MCSNNLALLVGGKVYIASRSIERGVEAANDIKNTTGADDSKVIVLQLNLASFQSIRKFSEEFHKSKGCTKVSIELVRYQKMSTFN
jgi:hypothetical protein